MIREQDIHFVFEHGVLRPEGNVDLPEGARGIARIMPSPVELEERKRLALAEIRRIGDSGVLNSGGLKVSREQMHERR